MYNRGREQEGSEFMSLFTQRSNIEGSAIKYNKEQLLNDSIQNVVRDNSRLSETGCRQALRSLKTRSRVALDNKKGYDKEMMLKEAKERIVSEYPALEAAVDKHTAKE